MNGYSFVVAIGVSATAVWTGWTYRDAHVVVTPGNDVVWVNQDLCDTLAPPNLRWESGLIIGERCKRLGMTTGSKHPQTDSVPCFVVPDENGRRIPPGYHSCGF